MVFSSNVAEAFCQDIAADEMPSSPAILVDFFPAPPISQDLIQSYYDAYNRGVRSGKITPKELDMYVGEGPKLTVLVHRIDSDLPPIKTSYDWLREEVDREEEEY